MAENFCPQCGGKIEPGQTKCSFCGKDLTNLSTGTSDNISNTTNSYTGQSTNNQYTSQNANNQYTSQNTVNQYTSQNTNNQYTGQSSNNPYSNYQDNTANYSYQSNIPSSVPATPSANGLQIAGLVLGIISILTCCCYGVVGIIFGIAGLVCSILGNKESKHGMGTAGIICSIIGIVFGFGMLLLFILGVFAETVGSYADYL